MNNIQNVITKRKRIIIVQIISLILIIGYATSCGNRIPEPGEWQSIGLENKLVGKLRIIDDELYACAGQDGLYKINLKKYNSEWKYLGMEGIDTSIIDKVLNHGVTDVVKVGNDLIVSCQYNYWMKKKGIYRSSDEGKTWIPSDSGMIICETFPTTSQVFRLFQFSNNPSTIIAGATSSLLYKSIDCGKTWRIIHGSSGGSLIYHSMIFNPNNLNEIWMGIETGRFLPYIMQSKDSGENWEEMIGIPLSICPPTMMNSIYDIAIDSENDSTMYLGMWGLIAKTKDKGQTFRRILGWEDGAHMIWRIELNPEDPSEIFATGGYLIHSTDSGETWDKITPPDDRNELYALEINWDKRLLYVSASSPDNGIYRYAF
ncbi:MAG: hypothetical protein U5N56_05625 [Candidatus Marinimicrobia bacterium]|nr:hypothetical protein [Candidatus Neomarinimicrobiota bacterium]